MAVILVVDDVETERIRIAGLLRRNANHTILTAEDAESTLMLMEQKPIDLVITDLCMPNTDGIELIGRIREDFPRIPVILITGAGSEELAVRAIQEGATSCLSKSSSTKEILTTVERLLAARAVDLAHAELLRKMEIDEYEFQLPSRRVMMSAAAGFLRQRIQASAICPEKELLRLGIAVEEALLNACLHGNLELDSALREDDGDHFEELADERSDLAPWKDRSVHVHAWVTQEEARVVVRDEGRGFDPESLPDPTDQENLLKPHGRGIMIMKLFLDEVTWNDIGNQVTLVKKRIAGRMPPDPDIQITAKNRQLRAP